MIADSSGALNREHLVRTSCPRGCPGRILDLAEDALEVYRRSVPAPDALYRLSYSEMQRLARGATVSPEAAPGASVSVGDLLR
jgi:hypothetical protein